MPLVMFSFLPKKKMCQDKHAWWSCQSLPQVCDTPNMKIFSISLAIGDKRSHFEDMTSVVEGEEEEVFVLSTFGIHKTSTVRIFLIKRAFVSQTILFKSSRNG
jgi:hypothetical protein